MSTQENAHSSPRNGIPVKRLMVWAAGSLACMLLAAVLLPTVVAGDESKPKPESFSAMAYLPTGGAAGATANVNVRVEGYTSDQEVQEMAKLLLESGPDALLKALEKKDSLGRISLVGRVGFYDFKLVRSRPTKDGGRRIIAISDRPIGFLEAYNSGRSRDYQFGILRLDLKPNKKGKEEGVGALMYAAKVKVIEHHDVQVENFGTTPVRLAGVNKF